MHPFVLKSELLKNIKRDLFGFCAKGITIGASFINKPYFDVYNLKKKSTQQTQNADKIFKLFSSYGKSVNKFI